MKATFSSGNALRVALFSAISLCFLSGCAENSPTDSGEKGEIYSFQEPHMGTLFTIRVWLPVQDENNGKSVPSTVKQCTGYTQKAFDRIEELNGIFSDYLVESELSLLSKSPANEPIPVSDELLDILLKARDLHEVSDGVFDVTVGPMIRLWRRARKNGELPTPEQIAGAKARTGFEKIKIDPEKKTVSKLVDHMVFDLGGIAKGYAADEALRIMKEGGFSHVLVAASGDIALGDPPPEERGWKVGLETLEMAKPGEAAFLLSNAAVSTSGDTQRFLVIDGKRYSHIVDKETGFGLTERIAVSVIAPNATTSDSYATAVSLLGREKGMALIESKADLECRIVTVTGENDEDVKIFYSSGYPEKLGTAE